MVAIKNSRSSTILRPPYIFIILVLLLGVAAAAAVHLHHKTSQPITASQATKGELSQPGAAGQSNKTGTSANTQPDNSKDQPAGSSATLVTPTGDFVSDHHPNLSGSPAPNLESSVCTTTPGASCKITFTKDGVTKALTPETTDLGGSAYWDWKLQDVGLTAGSWQIQAVATLNGQTMSATDAMNLVVAP